MKHTICILITVMMFISIGCASSYHDREDMLASLDGEEPVAEEPVLTPPPVETPANSDTEKIDNKTQALSINDIPVSGGCLVNADCPTNKFCSLGECINECDASKPCQSGFSCSTRGRCVVGNIGYVDDDAPVQVKIPTEWYLDERAIKLDTNESQASFNIFVKGTQALNYRVQIEPAGVRDAVVIKEEAGDPKSGALKKITLQVDRSAFDAGDHRIAIDVVTDNGRKEVIYEFSKGFSGRYGGYINYQDPGLGSVPIVMDISIDGNGKVIGRIVKEGSLFFPVERALNGNADLKNKTAVFSTVDVSTANAEGDPFQRNIGREIYFNGDFTEQRVLKGSFEEVITGLLPQTTSVSGLFYLTRTSEQVDPVIAQPTPVIPQFPSVSTSFQNCAGFTSACNTEGLFKSNMSGCSKALYSSSFNLGTNFTKTNSVGDQIMDFGLVEECAKDEAGTGSGACVKINSLKCLVSDQHNYLLNVLAQEQEFVEYFNELSSLQRVYSFMGNDLIVDAYRTAVQVVTNPLTLEISRIDDARDKYELAERAFFSAANISVIEKATNSAVASNNYELFKVPLQYIQSSQSATRRYVDLSLRKNLGKISKKAELRKGVQEKARYMFLEGVVLAKLINSHGGTFKNELAQISDELSAMSSVAGTLETGLNSLGFPEDYVPFIYDPSDTANPTNFAQLANSANKTVSSAVRRAQIADSSTETMEVKAEEIEDRIEEIELSHESEILRICGTTSIDYLNECGFKGGELGLAFNDIQQQYIEIEKVHQQIMDLNQMVRLKRDTALQIMNIKGQTLMFVQSSGAKLEALDIAESQVRAAMFKKQGLFSSIGGFFSGVASIAGGIASAYLPIKPDPLAAVGGVAGGLSQIANGVMGGIAGAQNASSALALGRIQARKTEIQSMQQMRMVEEGIEIAAAEAAETVKMLLIQMAQLNLDLELADMRLSQFIMKADNLIGRVDFLNHQRDVLITQSMESVKNPLSNLSFRITRDHAVLVASDEFEKALADVYLVARGLEHELNMDLPQIESQLFAAGNAEQLQGFLGCLNGWYDDYNMSYGVPHEDVTQISLKEDILGFTDEKIDEVTERKIMPSELFRRVLLNSKHIDSRGGVTFPFVTSIAGGNKIFSTLVCNDRIKRIRIMLVGDFLGDNEATVLLRQEGNSYLRDCSSDIRAGNDKLNTYHLDERNSLIQAGVNSFGLASPNYELEGRSVASDRWILEIPTGAEAPANADIDFTKIDDVIIEITHMARTLNGATANFALEQCNI